MVDPRALARAIDADEASADAAAREGLDFDARSLGTAIRAYGVADSEGDERALVEARTHIAQAVARALERGEDGALRLRAYELRSFLIEVRRWEATGEETPELRELGGGFLRMLRRSGWEAGAPSSSSSSPSGPEPSGRRRVLMDDSALRAAWKRRWNEITGIRRGPFELTLDEQRSFYRFLLAHPITPLTARSDQGLTSTDVQAYADQYRLKKVDELGALDPAYPRDLARGILLYKLGRYLPAIDAFRRHLDASPDGPFTLRAQNYLRAALGRAQSQGSDPDFDRVP